MQGGGGGEGSASGSMSTVLREDNLVLSSEDSSCSDESELELGLGLSLGGGFVVVSRANVTSGVKRTADYVAANGSNQVVGWPPIRAYRMNSMANQAKTIATKGFSPTFDKNESKNIMAEKNNISCYKDSGKAKQSSLFVKVNMDGTPIGRKVDLNSHGCYETLAKTLEAMFLRPTTSMDPRRSSVHEDNKMADAKRPSKLLDGSAEFVLTYEDKEGDWMLVGDVPWGMFLSSVKRLRIMRTLEATGLAPSLHKGNEKPRSNRI
ncbi:hypothetical protein SLE2022_209080 [Rubroshorea leprosula]